MSNPKFNLGDMVAVCELSPHLLVIPKTVVTHALWTEGSPAINSAGVIEYFSRGWHYTVADHIGPDGMPGWYFEERCLRPLNPDDYSITEDEKELSL